MGAPALVATLTAILAATLIPARASPDPLSAHRWKHRVVVSLASSPADPMAAEQRRIFATIGPGARERDLVLLEATGDTPEARALRGRFGFDGRFRAVLVGKDGGEKLGADRPVGPDDLFPLIDAMPMRQDEMARRRRTRRAARVCGRQ